MTYHPQAIPFNVTKRYILSVSTCTLVQNDTSGSYASTEFKGIHTAKESGYHLVIIPSTLHLRLIKDKLMFG